MNNNSNYSKFAEILNTLTPFEFVTIGTIFGYYLSLNLNVNEQNTLGNWFELVGQILLTYSAQGSATPSNEEYQKLVNDVEMLKNIVLNK